MNRRRSTLLLALAATATLPLLLGGCATAVMLDHDGLASPYAGTRHDVEIMTEKAWREGPGWMQTTFALLAFFDLPLSLAADTVLFPISGPLALRDIVQDRYNRPRRNDRPSGKTLGNRRQIWSHPPPDPAMRRGAPR